MESQQKNKKLIANTPAKATTMKENWEVMRPFVHFAVTAMAVIGGALIGIVKLLPMLLAEHKTEGSKKQTRVIKIN